MQSTNPPSCSLSNGALSGGSQPSIPNDASSISVAQDIVNDIHAVQNKILSKYASGQLKIDSNLVTDATHGLVDIQRMIFNGVAIKNREMAPLSYVAVAPPAPRAKNGGKRPRPPAPEKPRVTTIKEQAPISYPQLK